MKYRHIFAGILAIWIFGLFFVFARNGFSLTWSFSDTEADFEEAEMSPAPLNLVTDPYANWTRPEGPVRVGLQVGHWNAAEAPEELEKLRVNTGASAAGITEWETSLAIAEKVKTLLEAKGITVDLLPTTIPPDYLADAFIAIHADGNVDTSVSGYKVAAPYRDRSGDSVHLAELLDTTYAATTDLVQDPNITRNMRGYYAFNWRKYEHSIHPMTPAVILETGFLTNANDRRVIVKNPAIPAQGIAEAVESFLEEQGLGDWS